MKPTSKEFNNYCADVMGYEHDFKDEDGDLYNPYYNLHQVAAVVEELINLTGEHPTGDILDSDSSAWQSWHDFIISMMSRNKEVIKGCVGKERFWEDEGDEVVKKYETMLAETLVKCGYADTLKTHDIDGELDMPELMWYDAELDNIYEDVDPFGDSLVSYKQSDALIDHFIHTPEIGDGYDSLWDESGACVIRYTKGAVYRIWVNERIGWCLINVR